MTLGQFSVAVGARPRWVQNAFAALGLRATYTEPRARRLAFAKALKDACRLPLKRGWALGPRALACWPAQKTWTLEGPAGGVEVIVDLERFLSDYAVRLSLSRTWYAEKQRGRRPKRPRGGVAYAKWYGVDVSLIEVALRRTPAERLRSNDAIIEDFKRSMVAAQ